MPAFKIAVLGYGGAFDFEEGHSSFYVQTEGGKPFLIDCGSTVLPRLFKHLNDSGRFLQENHIIITHTHEDHVGTLSGNIYARYFQGKLRGEGVPTKIISQRSVQGLVKNKLLINNNHKEEQIVFSGQGFYQELGVSIKFIDTTGFHFKDFPTSGVIIENKKGDILVISGDVNVPIFPFIEQQHPKVYEAMLLNPKKVNILHDVTTYNYPDNPHCFYKLLSSYKEIFPYLWPYHHDKGQMQALNAAGWTNLLGDYLGGTLET